MRKFKLFLIFTLLWVSPNLVGQINPSYLEKGNLSLGVRTTSSLFGHDGVRGIGTGGQFRLQLFDFLSTEWFADWITQDLKGAGARNDAHIGWSVLFYPKKLNRFTPYLITGHCFDYAEVNPLSTSYLDRSADKMNRWSSAAQGGIGSHFFLSDRFNLTVAAQYMLHFGQELNYHLDAVGDGYYLNTAPAIDAHEQTEGHLLLTFSLTYCIADLW